MPVSVVSRLSTAPAPRSPSRRTGSPDERVFLDLLDRHVEDASIRFTIRGEPVSVGRGAPGGVAIRINDDRFFQRVLSGGNLGLGESFMDGDWELEEGDIADLLTVLLRNRLDRKVRGDAGTALAMLRIQFGNLFRRKHWNHARFQYDQGDDLFEATLDRDWMMYSCGYALTPTDTAEQLQAQKLERICQKLELRPGSHLLDIGCGFGGMLMYAAKNYGVTGVGITTSLRHCAVGNQRLADAGLADRVRLEVRDHRTINGRFDRVVSIGMFEHLPRTEYTRFFERVAAVLPRDGIGLLHVVGANAAKNLHDPFTQKYALPGTGQPKLSELAERCERTGLAVRDVENMVRHYDPTASSWLANFRRNAHTLDPVKYDARFRRMWEYYLSCAIAGARASESTVYQLLFMKDYAAPMPMHRV
jgi:cyclopropane-fatty-acyl-phospholipid synthase